MFAPGRFNQGRFFFENDVALNSSMSQNDLEAAETQLSVDKTSCASELQFGLIVTYRRLQTAYMEVRIVGGGGCFPSYDPSG